MSCRKVGYSLEHRENKRTGFLNAVFNNKTQRDRLLDNVLLLFTSRVYHQKDKGEQINQKHHSVNNI